MRTSLLVGTHRTATRSSIAIGVRRGERSISSRARRRSWCSARSRRGRPIATVHQNPQSVASSSVGCGYSPPNGWPRTIATVPSASTSPPSRVCASKYSKQRSRPRSNDLRLPGRRPAPRRPSPARSGARSASRGVISNPTSSFYGFGRFVGLNPPNLDGSEPAVPQPGRYPSSAHANRPMTASAAATTKT